MSAALRPASRLETLTTKDGGRVESAVRVRGWGGKIRVLDVQCGILPPGVPPIPPSMPPSLPPFPPPDYWLLPQPPPAPPPCRHPPCVTAHSGSSSHRTSPAAHSPTHGGSRKGEGSSNSSEGGSSMMMLAAASGLVPLLAAALIVSRKLSQRQRLKGTGRLGRPQRLRTREEDSEDDEDDASTAAPSGVRDDDDDDEWAMPRKGAKSDRRAKGKRAVGRKEKEKERKVEQGRASTVSEQTKREWKSAMAAAEEHGAAGGDRS